MESILKGSSKIILDKAASQSGVLPYLPLPALKTPALPPAPAPAQSQPQR
jgi:hypothetical protein